MSRVDYCNVVIAGAPGPTDHHQQVATSVELGSSCSQCYTRKYDRGLRQLMHTELHWLDVPERIKYKLGVITR